MDAMKIANSIPMWIACGIPVILVIAQALIFAKKSYSAGKKIGLTTHRTAQHRLPTVPAAPAYSVLLKDEKNIELLLRFLNLEEKI